MPRNFLVKRTSESCEIQLTDCQVSIAGISVEIADNECVMQLNRRSSREGELCIYQLSTCLSVNSVYKKILFFLLRLKNNYFKPCMKSDEIY